MMLSTLGCLFYGRVFTASSSASVLTPSFESTGSHLLAARVATALRTLSQRVHPPADGEPDTQASREPPSSFNSSGVTGSRLHDDGLDGPVVHDEPGHQSAGTAGVSQPPGPGLQRLRVPQHVLRDLRPPVQPYDLAPKLAQRPTGTAALYTPWTPTRALQRRSHISRRMGFLMQVLEREQMERVRRSRPLPEFRAGDVLEIRMMVPEAERKVAIYRGVCIARYHKGLRSTFKIYNVFPECGGVVQHLPLYMPDLLGIKVVGRIPASQERLFYLLERESSDYTFQMGVTAAK